MSEFRVFYKYVLQHKNPKNQSKVFVMQTPYKILKINLLCNSFQSKLSDLICNINLKQYNMKPIELLKDKEAVKAINSTKLNILRNKKIRKVLCFL